MKNTQKGPISHPKNNASLKNYKWILKDFGFQKQLIIIIFLVQDFKEIGKMKSNLPFSNSELRKDIILNAKASHQNPLN